MITSLICKKYLSCNSDNIRVQTDKVKKTWQVKDVLRAGSLFSTGA